MEEVAELERVQSRILQRITQLELSYLPHHSSAALPVSSADDDANSDAAVATTEARLANILRTNGVRDFVFKRVPSDYYDRPLEARRDILGASSVHHLCKSIVLVNTQAQSNVTDCSDRNNSKYYVAVVQYSARFNAETVKNFLYSLNNGKIPKKKFNLRLAPEKTSLELTGYEHNGVTCVGMKTDIPVILDEAIVKLNPDFFWLGELPDGDCRQEVTSRLKMSRDAISTKVFFCWGSSFGMLLILGAGSFAPFFPLDVEILWND